MIESTDLASVYDAGVIKRAEADAMAIAWMSTLVADVMKLYDTAC